MLSNRTLVLSADPAFGGNPRLTPWKLLQHVMLNARPSSITLKSCLLALGIGVDKKALNKKLCMDGFFDCIYKVYMQVGGDALLRPHSMHLFGGMCVEKSSTVCSLIKRVLWYAWS